MAKKKKSELIVLSENKLRKKYPTSGKASIIAVTPEDSLRLPSRVLALNYQLNGGPRYGTMVELFGEESTGKSLLSMEFGYACQALNGQLIWIDAENSFERTWFEQNGIDLEKLELLTQENAIEKISDYIMDMVIHYRSKLIKNQPILIVLDSTAALDTLVNVNAVQTDGKAEMGNRAKEIYKFFRRRSTLLSKLGIIFIMINQLRSKVGATQWEDPDTTPGGKAAKFYAHQRIEIRRGKQIKKRLRKGADEEKIGQNVYIKTKKDKTGPPRSQTETEVYFVETSTNRVGFSPYTWLGEALLHCGTITKDGNGFVFNNDKIARGEEHYHTVLEEDKDLRKSILDKSPINTIAKTRTKLEAIKINLYPVGQIDEDEEDSNNET